MAEEKGAVNKDERVLTSLMNVLSNVMVQFLRRGMTIFVLHKQIFSNDMANEGWSD